MHDATNEARLRAAKVAIVAVNLPSEPVARQILNDIGAPDYPIDVLRRAFAEIALGPDDWAHLAGRPSSPKAEEKAAIKALQLCDELADTLRGLDWRGREGIFNLHREAIFRYARWLERRIPGFRNRLFVSNEAGHFMAWDPWQQLDFLRSAIAERLARVKGRHKPTADWKRVRALEMAALLYSIRREKGSNKPVPHGRDKSKRGFEAALTSLFVTYFGENMTAGTIAKGYVEPVLALLRKLEQHGFDDEALNPDELALFYQASLPACCAPPRQDPAALQAAYEAAREAYADPRGERRWRLRELFAVRLGLRLGWLP